MSPHNQRALALWSGSMALLAFAIYFQTRDLFVTPIFSAMCAGYLWRRFIEAD